MASSAIATVRLVQCFWCCAICCRCRSSFLIGSCNSLDTQVVAALVSPYCLPVDSLRRWASTVSSPVSLRYRLESFLHRMLKFFRCMLATPSTLRLQLLFSCTILLPLQTQAWRFCDQIWKGSVIGVVPVPLVS